MTSGFSHKQPQAIIDTEAGQLEALALAGKFVGTLSALLTNKDGIKNVNDALADFDKKHAEHKSVLAANRELMTEIENQHEKLDRRAQDLDAQHVANMGEVEVAHQQSKDKFEAEMKIATEGANQWLEGEKKKLNSHAAELETREQDIIRRTRLLDEREANLHKLEDEMNAVGKAHRDREQKLTIMACKLDERHNEVTALEKNALKG